MVKFSLPSLESLAAHFLRMLKRFPLEMLFALTGTYAGLQMTRPAYSAEDATWPALLICSALGLVFSLSASAYSETVPGKPFLRWLLRAGVLLLSAVYFFTFPERLHESDYYRFCLLAVTGHLLVSVAPFHARGHIDSFWQYNKALFLRFLTAALYSAVLFAGLSVALLALDELFGVVIKGRLYGQLWIVIAGLFNTAMFLSGVPAMAPEPDDGNVSPEAGSAYPKALKVFTQFVLVPLVSIYVIILLAYELKILVQWDLPRGWVSNLIIAFAVFGILSLLLVFPVRNTSGNKWIYWYGKAFYWIMLPLTALLFLAIGKRIHDYGMTVERFIVLATGCWLLFTALYFLAGRKENIKLIPASLIVVSLLTAALAFPASTRSQQKRLLSIFQRNGMLEGDRVVPAGLLPGPGERREITSIIRYLYAMEGGKPFREHFTLAFEDPDPRNRNAYIFTDTLMKSVGLTPLYGPETGGIRYFHVTTGQGYSIPLDRYDFYLAGDYNSETERRFEAGEHTVEETLDPDRMTAALIIDGTDTLRFPLEPLVERLIEKCLNGGSDQLTVTPEEAFAETGTERFRARLYVLSLSGNTATDTTRRRLSLRAGYLLGIKDPAGSSETEQDP